VRSVHNYYDICTPTVQRAWPRKILAVVIT